MKKFFCALCALILTACSEPNPHSNTNEIQTLYVYNWSEYVPDELIQKFEKETGIKVEYRTYESNEQMYSKLKLTENTDNAYDLIFPSSYYVSKMAREGMLQKLDKTKLSNIGNLRTDVLNQPFDPNNQYSLPYIFGVTGLAVDATIINPQEINSWRDLWNPRYARKIQLMNDSREVFHIALLLNGYSPNTENEAEIKQAYELLQKLAPQVKSYNSDAPEVPFLNGDIALGMMWNGSGFLAQKSNPQLKFIYPQEGAIIWMDNFAIPHNAKNPTGAYQFIDFLLRADNAKIVLEEIGYSVPNEKAQALLNDELKNNTVLFPPHDEVIKGSSQTDVGDAIDIYEHYWQLLRVQ